MLRTSDEGRGSRKQKVKVVVLPISEKKDEIISLLKKEQIVIVSGQTGSGKTTQLPQICLECGLAKFGKIALTQPRRIAATSIAQRVAHETKTPLGDLVGYKIRFSQKTSKNTRILCMTDGILLSELAVNPELRGYSVIIIDEAHERSLNIDLMLGYLRLLLQKRKDLKLIISSATMDTALFSDAFGGAPVVEVSGRMFDVEIIYDDIESGDEGNYIDRAVKSVEFVTQISRGGDVLVFMPTERDILETVRKIKGKICGDGGDENLVLPLFSRLTGAEQNRIFQDTDARKIIVSTNIAETSITLPKIKFVIDTGLARTAKYAPNLRTNRLPVEEISKAEAKQRAGRSGRVSEGVCIRLYSQKSFDSREEYRLPEIKRLNLAGVILQMLNLNLPDVKNFPFPEPPDVRRINDAISQLYELGALCGKESDGLFLTQTGKTMAKFPLEPHVSRMIIQAKKEGVLDQVAVIAAALSVIDPRERPAEQEEAADKAHQKFTDKHCDFSTLLKMWCVIHESINERNMSQRALRDYCAKHFLSFNRMREWSDVYEQISQTCLEIDGGGQAKELARNERKFGNFEKKFDEISQAQIWAVRKSVCAGLLGNIATFDGEKNAYLATKGRIVHLFPGSVLFGGKKRRPLWIMAHQITETSRIFARTAGEIDPAWVLEFAPDLVKRKYGVPYYDPDMASVVAEERVLFYGLEIAHGRKKFYGNIDPKEARAIFIQSALVEGATARKFDFLAKNTDLVHKLRTVSDGDLFNFYDQNLPEDIASDNQLVGLIKSKGGDAFLTLKNDTGKEFPDFLQVANTRFKLFYKRDFGKTDDGVSVEIPENELPFVDEKIIADLKAKKIRVKTVSPVQNPELQEYLARKNVKNFEKILENLQNLDPTEPIIRPNRDERDDYGYPAVSAANDGAQIKYYAAESEAQRQNPAGLAKLLEISLIQDFGWLEKKLRLPQNLKLIAKAYGGGEHVSKRLFEIVREAVCFPVTQVKTWGEFMRVREERLAILRKGEAQAVGIFAEFAKEASKVRAYLQTHLDKMPKSKNLQEIKDDLEVYAEQFTHGYCPLCVFWRYPVYVGALVCRIDKALNSPKHYEECQKTLAFYYDKSVDLVAQIHEKPIEFEIFVQEFCYLTEELSLKLFAEPKFKAKENISVKKMERFLEKVPV